MPKEEPKTKVSVRAVPVLGFHRIGKKFFRDEATIVEVTAEELAILRAEKNLVVEEAKPDQAPSAPPPAKKTADEMIAAIGECKTIDEVKPFFKDEERVSVIAAAKGRIAELKKSQK
jgi:hypothetical protein